MIDFMTAHQRLDQFTDSEIAQCEAELEVITRERTTATKAELLRGVRKLPPASDLLKAYVKAKQREGRRSHFGPAPDPADVFTEPRRRVW